MDARMQENDGAMMLHTPTLDARSGHPGRCCGPNNDHGPKNQFEKIIIHGHTRTETGKTDIQDNRINLDTGSAYDGPLTAMQLPEMNFWQAY